MTVTASFPLPPKDAFGNLGPMPNPFVAAVRTEIGAAYVVAAPSGSGEMLVVASNGTVIGSGTSVSFTASAPGVVLVVKSPVAGYVTMSLIDPPPGEIPDPLILDSLITRSQPFANVLAFGADPSGDTDSTDALQAAASEGYPLLLPPGLFIVSDTILVPSDSVWAAQYKGLTTIKLADGASTTTIVTNEHYDSASSLDKNMRIRGITFDGNIANIANTAYNPGVVSFPNCDDVIVEDCDVDNSGGFGAVYQAGTSPGLGQSSTLPGLRLLRSRINNFVPETGGGTTAAVYITSVQTQWTAVRRCIIDGCPTVALLWEDGANSFWAESNILNNVVSGIGGIGGTGPAKTGWITKNLIIAAASGSVNGVGLNQGVEDIAVLDNIIRGFASNGIVLSDTTSPPSGVFVGRNRISGGDGNGILLADCNNVLVTGNRVKGQYTGIAAQSTYENVRIADNDVTGNSNAGINTNGYSGSLIVERNIGYNPAGPQTAPTVPASGTALTNPFPFGATVYISGGGVTEVAIGGTSTGLTSGAFSVPAGESITLTYTSAPTWVWVGH